MEFNYKEYSFLFVGFLVLLLALLLPAKIALIIVSLLAAVYSFMRPKNALYLLLLYIPIRPLFTEVNSGLKLAGDIITFVVLIKVLWDSKGNWKSWFSFQKFEWAYFAFLIFGAIMGLVKGASITAVIFQLRTFLIMYILYYVVKRLNVTKEDFYKFSWITIMVSVLISIHGLIEKLSSRQWLLPEAWSQKMLSATNAVRIYGLPGNPNSLAVYLGFAIVLALFLLKKAQGKQRIVLYVLQTLFMGVILLTYSRGTWIALSVGIVVFLVFAKSWSLMKPIIITALLGLLLVYLPTNFAVDFIASHGGGSGGSGGIGKRFHETFDEKNVDLMVESGRIFYIKKGFEVFLDHPITGTGFATFGDSATLSYGSPIYDKYGIRSDIYGGKYFYSDNQYIQVIAETGVIGVILFAAFLLLMLQFFWKNRKATHFSYVMIAMWVATCAMGMYYNIWELKIFTPYYFMMMGAYYIYVKTKQSEK